MRHLAIAAIAAVILALGGAREARAQAEEQALVDRATLALNEIMDLGDLTADARSLLGRSRAAMVCPRVFRAGFIFGGAGGDCLLLARDGGGSWSSPAFYTMGGGSIGFQIGVQDAQVLVLIMNDKALDAILNSQFRFGAEAGVAFGTLGRGISGATTAAIGADIVTLARARGLFAGVSLDGNLLSARSERMRAYFGREITPRQIVVGMEAHNPGSDPLRAALIRLSGPVEGAPAPAPTAQNQQQQVPAQQGGAAPAQVITPGPGTVQSENLPPTGATR